MVSETMDTPKEISIHRELIDVETADEPDDTNDDDEGFQGDVAIHNQPQHPKIESAKQSASNSTSSWASLDDVKRASLTRQRQLVRNATELAADAGLSPPRSILRRNKTPTTNNLSTLSEFTDSIVEENTVTSLVPPTLILEGERDGGIARDFPDRNRETQEDNIHKSQQKQKQFSYRKSLANGMLETFYAVAGITLSTTETMLRPATAMTRDIILPGLIDILLETLDIITPAQVQDWFRILSTSVHHFFVVLVAGSSEKGTRFRSQVIRVAHSFLETWSAPESRQVVVDGMATSVRLADALHTPEFELFLEQLSILGCRLVDAMASGKSKELLHNTKDLMWTSIELACEPSTTLALAEITAHLCHALEEVYDSFTPVTPRATRNAQNEKTYLNASMIGSHESMEQIILSSLGMHHVQNENERVDVGNDADDGTDNDSAVQSIPSKVAFRVDEDTGSQGSGIPNLKLPNQTKKVNNNTTSWEKCKERVDLALLQKKILHEGRPLARPQMGNIQCNSLKEKFESKSQDLDNRPEGQKYLDANALLSSDARNSENKQKGNYRGFSNDIGEDFINIEQEMEDLPLPHESKNPPINIDLHNASNTKELYEKFEKMESSESDIPSQVRFSNAMNKLLTEKRRKKEHRIHDLRAVAEFKGDEDRDKSKPIGLEKKARVRKLQNGISKDKAGSRVDREKYSDMRRSWKYPPSLLRFGMVVILFLSIIWIGFGIYGMYTFFHRVIFFDRAAVMSLTYREQYPTTQHRYQYQNQLLHQQQPLAKVDLDDKKRPLPQNTKSDDRQHEDRTGSYRPNEIVIRIVKEVVHVREDGSRIENYKKSSDDLSQQGGSFEELDGSVFSQEEIDGINEFIVSHLEEGQVQDSRAPKEVGEDGGETSVQFKHTDSMSRSSVDNQDDSTFENFEDMKEEF